MSPHEVHRSSLNTLFLGLTCHHSPIFRWNWYLNVQNLFSSIFLKIKLQFIAGGHLWSGRSPENNLRTYLLFVKTYNSPFPFSTALHSNSFPESWVLLWKSAAYLFLLPTGFSILLTCSFIIQLQQFYLNFSLAVIFLIFSVMPGLYNSYSLLSF